MSHYDDYQNALSRAENYENLEQSYRDLSKFIWGSEAMNTCINALSKVAYHNQNGLRWEGPEADSFDEKMVEILNEVTALHQNSGQSALDQAEKYARLAEKSWKKARDIYDEFSASDWVKNEFNEYKQSLEWGKETIMSGLERLRWDR